MHRGTFTARHPSAARRIAGSRPTAVLSGRSHRKRKERFPVTDNKSPYHWQSYHASEHKDLSDVNSLRSANELDAIKRWPGWAEMAHLASQAYLRHPRYFSEWRDWAEA